MTDIKTEDFTATLSLPATPETIRALFTSADGVSRWWGPAEGDAAVGGTLVVGFGDYGVNAVTVVESSPNRIVWESTAPAGLRFTRHVDEWLGTTLEFDLVPDGEGTELRFRHGGLTPQLECWDECFAGWTHFLSSIEAFARTGTGTPFGS